MRLYRLVPVLILTLTLATCTASNETAPTQRAPTQAAPQATVPPAPSRTEPSATVAPTPVPPTPTVEMPKATMAFVQDKTLYIQDWQKTAAPLAVDQCEEPYCRFHHLQWSSNGQYLAYYKNAVLSIANAAGKRQRVSEKGVLFAPADWSPAEQALIYFEQAGPGNDKTLPLQINKVTVAANGAVSAPQPVGTAQIPQGGCGGGGRSRSEELYELEGGTSYGYLMGVTAWTRSGILLFTNNCTGIGLSRFDLNKGQQLADLAEPLRNLRLLADQDHWVAVKGRPFVDKTQVLVTGAAADAVGAVISTTAPVEMVYVGQRSGAIYFTSRTSTGHDEVLGAYFNFYSTTLWRLDTAGKTPAPLYTAADHAFAHVSEAPDGSIWLVRIENDTALRDALKTGASPEKSQQYLPQRHIVQLSSARDALTPRVPNAGSLALP